MVAILTGLGILFAMLLMVLWIILPLAVFRIKDLLTQILKETREANKTRKELMVGMGNLGGLINELSHQIASSLPPVSSEP